ncbi:hypothetical protein DLAC_00798 [Tieghemostelium lacteum]|uniref:Uncharacterized protein n=1 Tax=Tieghemostelium lacteum TaxID=361077 RepID=A0A152A795_TIELA|nr:hypothetical protein DLAC_00798 [Tieghemostelium lacteum]|eukprot:KYR02005.1 hypothetical protein DLAC_00798 [Tieghemostelium lacteum]
MGKKVLFLEPGDLKFSASNLSVNDNDLLDPDFIFVLSEKYSNGDSSYQVNGYVVRNTSGALTININNVKVNTPIHQYICVDPPYPIVNTLNTTVWSPSTDGIYYFTTLKLNLDRIIKGISINRPFNPNVPYMFYDNSLAGTGFMGTFQGYDTVVIQCYLYLYNYPDGGPVEDISFKITDGLGRISTITIPTFIPTTQNAHLTNIVYNNPPDQNLSSKQYYSRLEVETTNGIQPFYPCITKNALYFYQIPSYAVLGNRNSKVLFSFVKFTKTNLLDFVYYETNNQIFTQGSLTNTYNITIDSTMVTKVLSIPNAVIGTGNIPITFGLTIDNYNPFLITLISNALSEMYEYKFPYGVTSVINGGSITAWTSSLLSPYSAGITQLLSPTANTTYIRASTDTVAPVLNNIEIFQISDTLGVIRVNVSDNLSGIAKVYFSVGQGLKRILMLPTDIVEGSYNGPYAVLEVELDISQLEYTYIQKGVDIIDQAGNLVNIDDYFRGQQIPTFKIIDTISRRAFENTITFFNFDVNSFDLSDNGCIGTAYVNFSYVEKQFPISIQLDIDYQPIFTGYWDSELNMYSINFSIEARPFESDDVNFYILYLSERYHSSSLPTYGFNEKLSVFSQSADRMPPLVTSITKSSDFNDPAGGNVQFNITFSDDLNGIKNITIFISSNLDRYTPYYNSTFTIDEPGLLSFTAFVNFNVGPNCLNEQFAISYIKVYDYSNVWAVYDKYYLYSDPSNNDWSPMINFMTDNDTFVSVSCGTIIEDNQPPTVVINSTTLTSTGAVVLFTVKDDNNTISTRHYPKCYLHGWMFSRITAETQFVNAFSNDQAITFRCVFIIPNGFGYPGDKGYVSIHGYADSQYNYGGADINHLSNNIIPLTYNPRPLIKGISAVYTTGGTVYISGTNLGTTPSQVKITVVSLNNSNSKFYIPITMNNLYIQFELPPQEIGQLYIMVHVNSIKSNSYLVSVQHESTTTPQISCPGTPECGGPSNGVCTPIGCQCKTPWTGNDCLSQIVVVTPDIDPNDPDVGGDFNSTLPDGETVTLKSLISILALNEVDRNGQVQASHNFTTWIYTNTTSNSNSANQEYQYLTNITNLGVTTNVTVNLQYYTQKTIVVFANQVLEMLPSTIKYQIELSPYGFSSTLNTLQLVMSASIQSSENSADSCTYQESGDISSSDSNYIKLQIDQHSIYGRYIKRGIIDNRIQPISNIVLNTIVSNSTVSQTSIGINIPHYSESVLIDPDFSILVDTKPASDKENSICNNQDKKGLTKAQLAGIIIGCVGFGAVVVASISYTIYKKKRYSNSVKKIQNLSRSHE